MIALVTLGACCSTTADASAGVVVGAAVTGTTVAVALANAWYFGICQLAVLWIGLFAQQPLIVVLGGVPDVSNVDHHSSPQTRTSWAPRLAPVTLLRATLLVGGLTWALSVLAVWIGSPPESASITQGADWLLLPLGLGELAILAALRPEALQAVGHRIESHRGWSVVIRGTLGGAGLCSRATSLRPPRERDSSGG